MPGMTQTSADALVLVDDTNGITVIPQLSELRRLNWFDGKLLRADDLRVEQDYARGLVRRANRAGGRGVVDGMTVTLGAGGELHVGPGMAIDPGGRSLLLPVDVALDIAELIAKTAGGPPAAAPAAGYADGHAGFAECVQPRGGGQAPVGGARWYVVSVGWAEGLCGNEEVYGRLCEDACTTSTDRPWRMDGLVFRARPIAPRTALATATAVALAERHERSLVASALFADELDDAGSLIFGAGLRSDVWCSGAAAATSRFDEVPLALVGRAGDTTTFLDMWTARRERMETPPRSYWAGRMAMRPWNVFLAQVLQFQCQLADVLDGDVPQGPGGSDPCAERQRVLESALAELEKRPLAADTAPKDDAVLALLRKQVLALRLATGSSGARQVLLDYGITELPPAGYLPVAPAGRPALETQVRGLLGEGVDLTFCTTRHDAVARAFEDARDLDRISLLTGLDDPKRRQEVEIVVPDAEILDVAARDGWDGRLEIQPAASRTIGPARGARATLPPLDGAGRVETRDALALRWAGTSAAGGDAAASRQSASSFVEASIDRDPFALNEGEAMSFSASGDIVLGAAADRPTRGSLHGSFRVSSIEQTPGGAQLRGVVTAIANWRAVAADGTVDSNTRNLDRAAATLARQRTDDGGTLVRLRVAVDKAILTLSLTWHGDADTVELAGVVSRGNPGLAAAVGLGQPFARLTLGREPGALSPGSGPRVASEAALRALERAVGEPGYAQEAGGRLFPVGADGGLRLRATREWVLFRRRAVLRCGAKVEAAVATDTFAVFGRVDGPAAAAGKAYKPLGEVRFVSATTTLAGGSDAVASAWDDIAHGGELVNAVVVRGARGGDELGLGRVAELIHALSGVTHPAGDLKPAVVEPDDIDVDAGGADGILVVTATPAPVETAEVAVWAVDRKLTSLYVEAVSAQRLDAAIAQAIKSEHDLGSVAFAETSATPSKAEELDAVGAKFKDLFGAGGTSFVDVYAVTGDAAAGDAAIRTARATAVLAALGGDEAPRAFDVDEAVLEPARRARLTQGTLIVVVPAQTVAAAVVAIGQRNAAGYVRAMDAGDVQSALKQAFGAGKTALGSIDFVEGSATTPSPDEVTAVVETFKAKVGKPVRRVDVITVQDDPAGGDEPTRHARGDVVKSAVGGATDDTQVFAVPEDLFAGTRIKPERTIILVAPVPG
jgi:hypothetical protein